MAQDPSSSETPADDRAAAEQARARRRRRRRRVKSLAVLPSALTFGNGICGFAAIIELAKAYTHLQLTPRALDTAGEHMLFACIFIGIGMLLDMLDGKVARLTGTTGKFGAELDSLCDVVTFGVAPAFFLRVFGEATFGTGISEAPDIFVRLLWGTSALYLAAVLFRLARFNVEVTSPDASAHMTFRGLPSPAGAGGVVSLYLFAWHFMGPKDGEIPATWLFQVLIPTFGLAFAALMVSRIKYQHVFNRVLSGARTVPQVLVSLVVLVALYILAANHILPVLAGGFLLYILSGPAIFAWSRGRRLLKGQSLTSGRVIVTGSGESGRRPAVTDRKE